MLTHHHTPRSTIFREPTVVCEPDFEPMRVPLGGFGTMFRSAHSDAKTVREDLGDMQKPGEVMEAEIVGEAKLASKPAVTSRRMITAALLVAMMVTAVEQLVVSPAMPTIFAQLKGFEIYPWVVSAFLLATTVSTPIYGKLADLFGRKRVPSLWPHALQHRFGTLRNVPEHGATDRDADNPGAGRRARSARLCSRCSATSSRFKSARVQSLFGAVWGLSSVGGPLLGGYLTVYLSVGTGSF